MKARLCRYNTLSSDLTESEGRAGGGLRVFWRREVPKERKAGENSFEPPRHSKNNKIKENKTGYSPLPLNNSKIKAGGEKSQYQSHSNDSHCQYVRRKKNTVDKKTVQTVTKETSLTQRNNVFIRYPTAPSLP